MKSRGFLPLGRQISAGLLPPQLCLAACSLCLLPSNLPVAILGPLPAAGRARGRAAGSPRQPGAGQGPRWLVQAASEGFFWRKHPERAVSSPVGSLDVATEGVSAAEKPGCHTQGSCCSLILRFFLYFLLFVMLNAMVSAPHSGLREQRGPVRAQLCCCWRARVDFPAGTDLLGVLRHPGRVPPTFRGSPFSSPALPQGAAGRRRRRRNARSEPFAEERARLPPPSVWLFIAVDLQQQRLQRPGTVSGLRPSSLRPRGLLFGCPVKLRGWVGVTHPPVPAAEGGRPD